LARADAAAVASVGERGFGAPAEQLSVSGVSAARTPVKAERL
jgi:hypothetical protein